MGLSVPADMSVIGFDNVRECEKFVPSLTTIKQNYSERATLALQMLKQLKDGVCREKNILLPVTLIERDTVNDVKLHKKCN